MEFATAILAAWSAAIYAVIRVLNASALGAASWWARVLPLMPLILGALSGPTVIPLIAEHVAWLSEVGPLAAVVLGVGAGAVAASGHKAQRQTMKGEDHRIKGKTDGI